MAVGYRERLKGDANPNARRIPPKVCATCSTPFFTYTKTRRFCSRACYHATRPKAPPKQVVVREKKVKPPPPPKRPSAKVSRDCLHCRKTFQHYRSARRLFCSYQCHLDSGGALRAGLASAAATMKYGAKKDANHAEVMAAIRELAPAYDLSDVGRGLPDGVAWVKDQWILFDIKNPKTGYGRRGLNPIQQKWIDQWKGGPVYLVYSEEDGRKLARGEFSQLKRVDAAGKEPAV
jgi:hypothetical protein